MDAGLLDVLHDGGDERLLAVAERVDVELDRPFEEAVDEHAPALAAAARDFLGRVADAHVASAEDVRRPDEHRVADLLRDRRPPLGRLAAMPQGGTAMPSSPQRAAKRSRSSARSTASNGVPRIAIARPASSARASLSGVWPPNWMTTPAGRSRAQISSTSSAPSGSK